MTDARDDSVKQPETDKLTTKQVCDELRLAAAKLEAWTSERPFVALGMAVAVGFLLATLRRR